MDTLVNTTGFDIPTRNITRKNCDDLRSPDYVFVLLSLTLLIVATAAVIFNYIFLTLLRETAIFHQNVRSLLVNAELGTTLASGCLILRATFYHWPLSAMGFDYLQLHSTHCAMLECLFIIGVAAMMLSLAGIGLERLCATWRWAPKKATYNVLNKHNDMPLRAVGSKRRRTLPTLTRQTSEMASSTSDRPRSDKTGPFVKGFIFGTWVIGVFNVVLFYCSALKLDRVSNCNAFAAGNRTSLEHAKTRGSIKNLKHSMAHSNASCICKKCGFFG